MSLNYAQAVRWYYDFARFHPNASRLPDELKLARMREILEQLNRPHEKFPSILIAGTKGKGSTAALLESILRASGYRTGLFTSPHLHSFRERIRLNGEMISAAEVIRGTSRLQSFARQFPTSTFFEWVTALAFDYFSKAGVEIAVIEVGLGGRLDCTNVLTPLVSVITPISYDHMEILGNTLASIAGEKAGIIKPNIPVIVAPQEPEAMHVIARTASAQHAPLTNVAEEWCAELVRATPDRQTVRLRSRSTSRWHSYSLPLLGPHQRTNLATALATVNGLRAQDWHIPFTRVRNGVEKVRWYARFEILSRAPYLVVDGAHNRASADELVRTLEEVFPEAKVHFIFGASTDKDIAGMLDEISPRAASITLTQSQHARAAATEDLADIAQGLPFAISTAPTVRDALDLTRSRAAKEEVICVTGSLFIAAEARAAILGSSMESDE